ncbi:efflux RND transporter periplasmic adaptor subunit [Parasulfuritortus cantonensis]|uniref:Efflux RND transporter periplasmic adaptor subunit n=1 Tax=Parasulfuritortus cantonensis TaxID=2528202 RepID=A0A4R1B466_9PROT|nr:efflux RND transporter periplasmic adaptor subunit [Parasulfuritortus cantonensis]TCJ12884.1 efflux RND transporter periplasmic adaptor subunit [Parasulfuritortus cantonensis]
MNKLHPLVFALALTVAGCGGHDKSAAEPAHNTVKASVITLQPVDADVMSAMPGTVVALESVKVASRLMGYIKNIAVAEGQPVKAGERLFTIDPLDIEGGVAQARLGLDQAEKAMQDAKADYERFDALYKDEVVTRQQYEKMKLNYEIATARAGQAKAGLNTAQGQMKYAVVGSPINGVVTQKLANEGDIAAPGYPVLLVENQSRLQVQTTVPEAIYAGLKVGAPIRVEVDGMAEPLEGKLARLSPAADPMTHTHLVKIDVAAPGLRSGAFARVLFATGRQSVLRVPHEAVLNRAGITGVFVVDAKGVAQYRMVRTGREEAGQVEILSGLSAGERVVTGNGAAVNNGDTVQG